MQTFVEKIKQLLDIPFIPAVPFGQYNEVPHEDGCPKCGETDIDQLQINDEDFWPETRVLCLTCNHWYTL